MHSRKLKFHIMALSGMIISVVLVFVFGGGFEEPEAPKPVIIKQSPYAVLVWEANFGQNCIETLNESRKLLEKRLRTAKEEDTAKLREDLDSIPPAPARNNALEALSLQCNNLETCEVDTGYEAFDFEQPPFCEYELVVLYRCSTYDRLKEARAYAYSPLTLDCSGYEDTEAE